MKVRHIILAVSLVIFNSCIVKSINPFYTQKSISFSEAFLGNWIDNENGNWTIVSFKKKFLEQSKELSKEDEKLLSLYEKSYKVIYTSSDGKDASFLATPFKIKNQYFLDFIPVDFDSDKTNLLINMHIVFAHSLVRFDVLQNGTIQINWFDGDELKKLFEENRIKMQHQKTGLLKDEYLLTASSEELELFLKKYIDSNNPEKWETSTTFTLIKK